MQRWGNKSNTNINAFQTILTKQVKRPLEYDYILLYVFLHFLCTLFKIFCMNFRIWLVRWQNWILIHFNTVIEIYWNYKHVIIFCNEYFRCIWTTVIIWIELRFLLLTEYHDSTKFIGIFWISKKCWNILIKDLNLNFSYNLTLYYI